MALRRPRTVTALPHRPKRSRRSGMDARLLQADRAGKKPAGSLTCSLAPGIRVSSVNRAGPSFCDFLRVGICGHSNSRPTSLAALHGGNSEPSIPAARRSLLLLFCRLPATSHWRQAPWAVHRFRPKCSTSSRISMELCKAAASGRSDAPGANQVVSPGSEPSCAGAGRSAPIPSWPWNAGPNRKPYGFRRACGRPRGRRAGGAGPPGASHTKAFPGTARRSAASAPGSPPFRPWAGSRTTTG